MAKKIDRVNGVSALVRKWIADSAVKHSALFSAGDVAKNAGVTINQASTVISRLVERGDLVVAKPGSRHANDPRLYRAVESRWKAETTSAPSSAKTPSSSSLKKTSTKKEPNREEVSSLISKFAKKTFTPQPKTSKGSTTSRLLAICTELLDIVAEQSQD